MTLTTLLLALASAAIGSAAGIGGAVLLVPALVIAGVAPSEAAPLGLICVAAGSIAAGPGQLRARTVNHRLGVSTELFASVGAAMGAIGSASVSEGALRWVLVASALLAAAAAGLQRGGMRNPFDPACGSEDVGERVGLLSGAYPIGNQVVPYSPRRTPLGLGAMSFAGLIAGLSGTSGGFIKTPIMTEVMFIPHKVAGATSVFSGGLTAATALGVFAAQGRIDYELAAGVVLGAVLGGTLGGTFGNRFSPVTVRRFRAILLLSIGAILVATR